MLCHGFDCAVARFDAIELAGLLRSRYREGYRRKAAAQLGTGNHYVDLMRDEEGFVWVGVHFGSRGLGHSSAPSI